MTIDWGTKIINVLKADLTLIQLNPTEIRELDLNWFHLELKSLEATENGMPFLDTHIHNTEVTLGGLTYARVIEIINGYTVTFEDDQYAVNLVGANSNVADVVNVNQVSVRSNNAAGLISTPLIEFSSFEGGVWWDPNNETGLAKIGTIFPAGTRLQPSLNLSDVKEISTYRGFNLIYVMGSGAELDTAIDFNKYIFEGQTHVNNDITILSVANVAQAIFRELKITGTLDGGNELVNCEIEDIDYVNGHVHDSGLIGLITLAGNSAAILANCFTLDPYDPIVINMGGSGQDLIMPNYSGLINIENLTGANFVGIGLNAGSIILNSASVTGGTIQCSGIGTLRDEVGNYISGGTWNGGVTIINDLINKDTISDSIWNKILP